MRKVLVVLVMLLLFSCEKDDCECIKETYTISYDDINDYSYNDYKFELLKSESVDCTDEIECWNGKILTLIKCY